MALAIDGVHRGVWNFNLKGDNSIDRCAEDSASFHNRAGFDLSKHATERLASWVLGRRLAESMLFGKAGAGPLLITFAGQYDLAFLVKLLTCESLPTDLESFKGSLANLSSGQLDIRDYLPDGSLQSLLAEHNIQWQGYAHTAGSYALATLELFAHVAPDLCIAVSKTQTVETVPSLWRKAARIAMLVATSTTPKTIESSGPSLGNSLKKKCIDASRTGCSH